MYFTKTWKAAIAQHLCVLYLKINSEFHARKNPKQQYLKIAGFSDPSFSKKHIYAYDHTA